MGYYIFSYGINTEQIKKIFGSKDEVLFKHIQENEQFQHYSGETTEYELSLSDALEHIIFGLPYDKEYAYQYIYAFICICYHLGEHLPYKEDLKLGYVTDLINDTLDDDFDLEGFGIELLLFPDVEDTFGLPDVEDWPMMGIIPFEQLKVIQTELDVVKITNKDIQNLHNEEEVESAGIYENIRGFQENIAFCIKNKLDLISFCH